MSCFFTSCFKRRGCFNKHGSKGMKELGKPMKVMEAKVGLLLELGSNEAQPTNRALKDMKA